MDGVAMKTETIKPALVEQTTALLKALPEKREQKPEPNIPRSGM
jgi:hypothetical protein